MELLKRVEHSRKKEYYIHVTAIDQAVDRLGRVVEEAAEELGIDSSDIYGLAEGRTSISDRCTEGMTAYLFGQEYGEWLSKARRDGEHTPYQLEKPEVYDRHHLEDIEPDVLEVLEDNGFIEPLESEVEQVDGLIADTLRSILGIHVSSETIAEISDRSLSDEDLASIKVSINKFNESGHSEDLGIHLKRRILGKYLESIGAIE